MIEYIVEHSEWALPLFIFLLPGVLLVSALTLDLLLKQLTELAREVVMLAQDMRRRWSA